MTFLARYLTHPQVKIDPALPVPSWELSALGRARTEALAKSGCLSGTTQIISSGERKAIETAEIIAQKLNVAVEVREAMHENDRSATGFLPADEFDAAANEFFAKPLVAVKGWERAIDAQVRIVHEVEHVLAIEQAMCSSSAMVRSALFYFVTMQVLPLIEYMTNPVGAVTALRS